MQFYVEKGEFDAQGKWKPGSSNMHFFAANMVAAKKCVEDFCSNGQFANWLGGDRFKVWEIGENAKAVYLVMTEEFPTWI